MSEITTAETMTLDGGDPSLDFVNSGYDRKPGVLAERLHTYSDLIILSSRLGIVDQKMSQTLKGQAEIDPKHAADAIKIIHKKAIEYINRDAPAFPGTNQIIEFFKEKQFKIGLATSSPLALVDVVLAKLKLENQFDVLTSAEHLSYGKPHPQVYIECAAALESTPISCLCFEDSFNGMIAAKAAKMKCVVVPHVSHQNDARWGAADKKLNALTEFNDEILDSLQYRG